ncbi:MAG TPA: respiratory nitrate reductase subunit gamma [Anaerolineaceae bacterium]|nr:MAG: respiratory nitrate reductase subunit gamma [Chloroflexi bacterium GWB2_54_36]HAL17089.1 respiratory nitrate reductase subunit gamma [Anaerolineaceae bacterium]
MDWNTIFFVIWPYISLTIFVVVTVYRSIIRPFSISSLSSQLLENKQLYWGSISFHYGIVLVLLGHLLALLIPRSVVLWNAVPLRLYLLEITGLGLGLWSLAGLLILVFRRVTVRRVQVVTTPMDAVVLAALLVSVISGVLVATLYRFGSYWFTGVFSPYLLSLVTFTPQIGLVAPLPWLIKLHVINNFVLAAIFPFSRLVHIFTYPIGYLIRPWQIVLWNRKIRTQNTQ